LQCQFDTRNGSSPNCSASASAASAAVRARLICKVGAADFLWPLFHFGGVDLDEESPIASRVTAAHFSVENRQYDISMAARRRTAPLVFQMPTRDRQRRRDECGDLRRYWPNAVPTNCALAIMYSMPAKWSPCRLSHASPLIRSECRRLSPILVLKMPS
jgi:hypothetical protein